MNPVERAISPATQEKPGISIILAQPEDLEAAKRLADRHKNELGFINRAILRKAIEADSLLIARTTEESELVGLAHFYVRRDQQITLYSIVVEQQYQRLGVGRQLFSALVHEAVKRGKQDIVLKCPIELPANRFYKHLGLQHVAVEPGKQRSLNIWKYTLSA
ncbi:acetyltransferase (GNAT) family protein [Thermosporothrix hazakensis]|jgi:GNAT superfamily N-acetyltransferase|uniref:Acetyltransferase (GNAT) family protein n=1 Tax=Thermosporothrix hazakensis TaxID=644383 RepID=A0A326UA22_THEHA|nr:GNAT family N-acetyltransferase [Thermosporothrix hazakensis]PZW32632.1 acetyltransferase (GNAT) family protein [Thermosporothrix hazakensis]GCE49985.1 hypothetical protein KTH_48540 [Thermosporothrix hazakensis]